MVLNETDLALIETRLQRCRYLRPPAWLAAQLACLWAVPASWMAGSLLDLLHLVYVLFLQDLSMSLQLLLCLLTPLSLVELLLTLSLSNLEFELSRLSLHLLLLVGWWILKLDRLQTLLPIALRTLLWLVRRFFLQRFFFLDHGLFVLCDICVKVQLIVTLRTWRWDQAFEDSIPVGVHS